MIEKIEALITGGSLENLDQFPNATKYEGDCGHTVLLSPSSMALLEDPRYAMKVMCGPCSHVKIEETRKTQEVEVKLAPGALKELSESVPASAIGELQAFFQKTGIKEAEK